MSDKPPIYFGPPFYFCRNQNPRFRIGCQGELLLPKKAIIFNKPENRLTRREINRWRLKFKIR